jgi:hypothetical protein
MAFDASNNLYMSLITTASSNAASTTNGNSVYVIAPDGTTSQISSGACCGGGDGTYATGQFYAPILVSVNKNGVVLVHDNNTGSTRMATNGQIVSLARGGTNASALMPTVDGNSFNNYMTYVVADSQGTFYGNMIDTTYRGIIKFWLV